MLAEASGVPEARTTVAVAATMPHRRQLLTLNSSFVGGLHRSDHATVTRPAVLVHLSAARDQP